MIKLVIFDLWQTLAYRKGDYHHRAIKKMLIKTGVKIPLEKFVKLFENSVQTKKWKSKHNAYKNLCKNMGLKTTDENINLLLTLRDSAEAKTRLYSHSIPMLKQLRKHEYKIGLISNSSVFAVNHIKKTGLLRYIDYPLFSCDAGTIKPDLKIFRSILKKTKCKPENCVMIGDKMNDDVIPPRKLGMNSILYTDYNSLKRDLKSLGVYV